MQQFFVIFFVYFVLLSGSLAHANEFLELSKKAKNTQVTMAMWGGSSSANRYIDDFLIPLLKEEYNITLQRLPIDDPKLILQKIAMEKKANKIGQVDIVWINGENFILAKQHELLYGPVLDKLPNVQQYVNLELKENTTDFTEPTEGLEVPWGRSQFILIYDSLRVKKAPRNLEEISAWIQEHPGRFTYPRLPDFTGSAFIRSLLMQKLKGIVIDQSSIQEYGPTFFTSLRDLTPYLYGKGEYPANSAMLDLLFSRGLVDFTFSYNPAHVANKVATKLFPESTTSSVLEDGSLTNIHFLAVPITAPNKEAALVVINTLLSPKAQYEKARIDVWGDAPVLDMDKLSSEERELFIKLDTNPYLPDRKLLQTNAIPELSAETIEEIEKLWEQYVP